MSHVNKGWGDPVSIDPDKVTFSLVNVSDSSKELARITADERVIVTGTVDEFSAILPNYSDNQERFLILLFMEIARLQRLLNNRDWQ